MLNEFLNAFLFYIVFSLFGVIGLPFVLRLKKKNTFTAYLITKPLGLVLFAYPVWILSYVKLIKFNNQAIIITLFILALIASTVFSVLWFRGKNINWKKVLIKLAITELISLFLFFSYLYMRGFSASLESTEKFMDLHLFMSAGKTDYFPFADGWWPSKDINYYYYGFYLFALINRIASVPYSLGYNFSLGLIFTFTVLISFSIVYKITKSFFFSAIGSAFVSFAGNLHYAKCLFVNAGKDYSQTCYYPKATRILQPDSFTINEMPSYSFILGDMHPHVMGIPFFLMNLYLLLLFYKSKSVSKVLILCLSFGLATSAMVNTWDFMALSLIFAFIGLEKMIRAFVKYKKIKPEVRLTKPLNIFLISLMTVVASLILFMPFFLKFKSPVEGIGFSPTYINHPFNQGKNFQYPSTFSFLFGIWGAYFIFGLISLLTLFVRNEKFKKFSFPTYLFITGIILVMFTELFYFKDLFHVTNPSFFRANTVFKLGYIAWMMMSLGVASLLCHMWKSFGKVKSFGLGLFADFVLIIVLFAYGLCVFSFTFYSIKQAYGPALPWSTEEKLGGNGSQRISKLQNFTLDGSAYIKFRNPNDLETIKWLNENQKERIVLVESVGGAYTYHARIGVNTGMMNPVNWPTHEWTWRFAYPKEVDSWKDILGKSYDTGYTEISKRIEDVRQIYESTDLSQTKSLLTKHNVKYVYVGKLEREDYKNIQENKFNSLGKVVFKSGDSKLYEIKH